ncbi:MAG: hypothetical protein ACP5VE_03155 [Chthonomonadales bacterium]
MSRWKQGDRVRIVAREVTADDLKNQTYFGHYGGLTGTVQKVYNDLEIAVEVHPESLSQEIRDRHLDVRNQMKTKWLEGLSEEGRSHLTEREKDFNLRYVVLVSGKDLEKVPGEGGAPSAQGKGSGPKKEQGEHVATIVEGSSAARKTLAEIEAAEQAELLKRASGEK